MTQKESVLQLHASRRLGSLEDRFGLQGLKLLGLTLFDLLLILLLHFLCQCWNNAKRLLRPQAGFAMATLINDCHRLRALSLQIRWVQVACRVVPSHLREITPVCHHLYGFQIQ